MGHEAQAACGFSVSVCSAISSFALAWMPLLQLVAVVVAIASGLFAMYVSWRKLRSK